MRKDVDTLVFIAPKRVGRHQQDDSGEEVPLQCERVCPGDGEELTADCVCGY